MNERRAGRKLFLVGSVEIRNRVITDGLEQRREAQPAVNSPASLSPFRLYLRTVRLTSRRILATEMLMASGRSPSSKVHLL